MTAPYEGDLAPDFAEVLFLFHQIAGFRGLDSEREFLLDLIIAGAGAKAGRPLTDDELTRAASIRDEMIAEEIDALMQMPGEAERRKEERRRMKIEERRARGTMTPMDMLGEMLKSSKSGSD